MSSMSRARSTLLESLETLLPQMECDKVGKRLEELDETNTRVARELNLATTLSLQFSLDDIPK